MQTVCMLTLISTSIRYNQHSYNLSADNSSIYFCTLRGIVSCCIIYSVNYHSLWFQASFHITWEMAHRARLIFKLFACWASVSLWASVSHVSSVAVQSPLPALHESCRSSVARWCGWWQACPKFSSKPSCLEFINSSKAADQCTTYFQLMIRHSWASCFQSYLLGHGQTCVEANINTNAIEVRLTWGLQEMQSYQMCIGVRHWARLIEVSAISGNVRRVNRLIRSVH